MSLQWSRVKFAWPALPGFVLIAVLATLVAGRAQTAPATFVRAADTLNVTSADVDVSSSSSSPSAPGAYFAPGAVTLSTEVYELGQDDLDATHASLVNYFKSLGPGTLRIGGETADESWWTSSNEPAPSWAQVTVTPADLVRLEGFLAATGWRVILSVNLGRFDSARAANEVTYASQILGANLAGIEVGNEPNDYGLSAVGLRSASYSVTPYIQEIGMYAAAIEAAVPGTKFYGPDTSAQTWYDFLAAWTASPAHPTEVLPFSELTEHYYPTSYSVASSACAATAVPTAQQLLSPSVFSAESSLASDLVSKAAAADVPATIDETNDTASCDQAGGPDTSPVFASAIWALDWSLRAASAGVSAIGFHDEFGTCGANAYSPICAANSAAERAGDPTAQPEYDGLLAAADLEGGRFTPVSLTSAGSTSDISAFATVSAGGKVTLAIINSDFGNSLNAQVTLPGAGTVTVGLLDAPSPLSTSGQGFTNVTASSDVHMVDGSQRTETAATVTLPSVSAVIITLSPTGSGSSAGSASAPVGPPPSVPVATSAPVATTTTASTPTTSAASTTGAPVSAAASPTTGTTSAASPQPTASRFSTQTISTPTVALTGGGTAPGAPAGSKEPVATKVSVSKQTAEQRAAANRKLVTEPKRLKKKAAAKRLATKRRIAKPWHRDSSRRLPRDEKSRRAIGGSTAS